MLWAPSGISNKSLDIYHSGHAGPKGENLFSYHIMSNDSNKSFPQ